jgi:hypothetical protein
MRDPPFREVRLNNTITTCALRMNDVIRWCCTLVKEVFEAVQCKVLHSRAAR